MNLFDKLSKAQGVKMLCGLAVAAEKAGDAWQFAVTPVATERTVKPAEYILLALHYHSHVLTRFPRSRPETERIALDIQENVRLIIEEGIWTDSDIIRSAEVGDRARLVDRVDGAAAGIAAALIRPLMGDDLDIAVEALPTVTDEVHILSTFAVLQGIMPLLDAGGVKLFDFALRHLKALNDEGGDYSDPAAARNMANRAFREAGGEACKPTEHPTPAELIDKIVPGALLAPVDLPS